MFKHKYHPAWIAEPKSSCSMLSVVGTLSNPKPTDKVSRDMPLTWAMCINYTWTHDPIWYTFSFCARFAEYCARFAEYCARFAPSKCFKSRQKQASPCKKVHVDKHTQRANTIHALLFPQTPWSMPQIVKEQLIICRHGILPAIWNCCTGMRI